MLRNQVLQLLRQPDYQPLDKVELSKRLKLPSDRRSEIRDVLRDLEETGAVTCGRKKRYALPDAAGLITGRMQFHISGGAHLLSEKKEEPDLYIARERASTARHGDKVVARVLGPGRSQQSRGRIEGEVVRVIERASDTMVGTLQVSKHARYVVADDPRFAREVFLKNGSRELKARAGEKVVVKLDEWTSPNTDPTGEIIEVLGLATNPGVDMLSIIRKYNLPMEFPPAALREAERIAETIDPRELETREDLRDAMIVTIDPDDAKDFDDAILVEPLNDGWRLGVHIADVSHYVFAGTVLDREAFRRGNSVYLADRVIPMLPERLSNGICSLKPGVDRLTRSAFIDFSKQGAIRSFRFSRSVIRSAARLTYKEAFALLGQKPGRDAVAQRVHAAWDLASLLRRKRFANGSLDLDFPEVKVWLDEEGRATRMEKIENDISHQLIEECMLAANEVVAQQLKNRQVPAIYRVHEDPDPEKLKEYRELIRSYQLKVGDLTQRKELQRLLEMIKGKHEEYALKLGLLKSLKRATYATAPLGHYGLAKVNYTHFTSPIRRYADLVVHRSLDLEDTAVRHPRQGRKNGTRSSIAAADLGATAEHISTTERVATDAERDSVKVKKMEFFQNQLNQRNPQAFPAVVVEVRNFGLLVELPEFLFTGLVHVSSLGDDYHTFDPVRQRITGRRKGTSYGIGDRISVIVAKVDAARQQVDFHRVG